MDFPKSVPGVGLVGGIFVDEDVNAGRPGSLIPAAWGNAVTQELLNVIEQAGMVPDESITWQLRDAILMLIGQSGGMPRFTPYIWGGRGDAMPEGDQQSSGQQLADLMYPTMRADVMASQFYCTEAEWQADPYKRATHWSLGEGSAWMRPPDKNGVQPGNVGPFYGTGSNPAGGKTGTAVIDAMRNISAFFTSRSNFSHGALETSGAFSSKLSPIGAGGNLQAIASGFSTDVEFDASKALPAGTTTDPITGEFRPRTWYGIWMIRMYGRIANAGALDASALNARMDMIDARVSTLEGRKKALGDGQARRFTTFVAGTIYTVPPEGRAKEVGWRGTTTVAGGTARTEILVGSTWLEAHLSVHYSASGTVITSAVVYPGESFRFVATTANYFASWEMS